MGCASSSKQASVPSSSEDPEKSDGLPLPTLLDGSRPSQDATAFDETSEISAPNSGMQTPSACFTGTSAGALSSTSPDFDKESLLAHSANFLSEVDLPAKMANREDIEAIDIDFDDDNGAIETSLYIKVLDEARMADTTRQPPSNATETAAEALPRRWQL
mmetsp:Transcript_22716/g.41128  ORF Transcript_22716/g.41128 Transcript_22716/m.41128 type:complete len:160 (+) Transcript_22716:84-563(+)|eukprot:CAMPEP_0197638890 /NCGR_PEP_ID=MMETSP1338-20131121/13682_1 /TAXON_ID=43686 ORGANISM="Pelagodinium beii, Strain RCC1491" /NCGR_SAMPLE_ID=MMETSP1338 /ASSEMBLY_ACC=CAM_ASM_000754 /LENGTH=159 /DNA_ID=CAMNT_0043211545 /DNA_START=84 /DNA_END=563 /DNA_ORIENTATION=-